MASPSPHEQLNTEEFSALSAMFTNPALMSALNKVFSYEERVKAESMENEALSGDPNVYRIIQNASGKRAAREWLTTIKSRMASLARAR